jgi:hypothetical protein
MYNRKSRNKKIEMTTKTSKQVEIKLTSLLSFRRAVEARGFSFSKSLFPQTGSVKSVSLPAQANAYSSVDDDGPSKGRQPQDSWTWEDKTTTIVLTYQTKIDNKCKTLSIYLSGGTSSEV